MKRASFIAGLALLLSANSSYAQNTSTIAGGPHDLSTGSAVRNSDSTINGQTCVFCHTPHGGSTNQPLWNRTNPGTAGYQVYTSSTSNTTATATAVVSGVSGACLSCHDGTIAMDVVTNVNGTTFGTAPTGGSVGFTKQGTAKADYTNGSGGTGNVMLSGMPFIGTDLRNDHPVAIQYKTAYDADTTHYRAATLSGSKLFVSNAGVQLPLYGTTLADATVECASCHDAHNNSLNGTNGGFLRVSNANSAMCSTCHNK
ncbi:MAG: hypothetical protein AB7Q29_07285 [Vicinamibacterales bacterium]